MAAAARDRGDVQHAWRGCGIVCGGGHAAHAHVHIHAHVHVHAGRGDVARGLPVGSDVVAYGLIVA